MMQVVQGWLLGMLIDDCRRLLIPDDATDLLISNATSTHNTSSQAENSDSFRVDLQVKNQIFLYCVGLVCAQMVYVQFINVYNFYAWRVGVRIRTAVGALIYRKALRLSSGAFRQTTPGQVVTMLTNDLMKIEFLFFFLPYPLLSMLITALVAILMYMYMGWLCLIAPALLAVYIPFQVQIGRLYQRFRRQSVRLTDERLRLMGDFLPAMRLIKMYAWEPQFARLIALARRREVSKIRAAAMLTCFNHGLFYVMGKCIVFVLLICWLLFGGGQLSAQLVFVTATLVGKMAIICGLHFPLAVMQIAHSQVAIRRLTRYFLLPEQSKTTVVTSAKEDDRTADLSNTACGGSWPEFTDNKPTGAENEKSAPDGCCGPTCVFFVPPPRMSSNTNTYPQSMPARLRFESITATYDEPIPKHTGSGAINKVLQEVSFEARDRTLTVVVGAVGAGKSSLLLCTLNELHVSRGQVHTNGRVSYAAQESWIFTGTVRDNILFGLPLCPKRYLQVIRVCALRRDLRLFSNGDQTLVGERGVSLSGGQRARLSLARALYRPADVYLLDDPLSAVDAHVAKHVYHQALRGFLRNKCVMLVTHQLQVIADAEQLILMRKGRIRLQGEFCTVVNQVLQEEEFGDLQASLGQRLSAEQVDAEILSSSSSASSTEEVAQEEGGSSDMTLSDEEWAADIGLFQSIKPPSASSSQISLSSQKEAETIPVNSLIQPVVLCASSLAADVSNKSDQPMEKTQNRNAAKVPAENCELSATWKAYRVYLKLGLNWWFAPLLVIVFCGTQALYSIVDYWMSLWTDSEERLGLYQQQLSGLLGMNKTAAGSVGTNESHWPEFEHRNLVDDYARGQNVLFYSIQMGLLFSLSLLRTVLFFVMCMKASVRLHDRLFERVIRAPVSFFDQNPVGILLNRVSRDLGKYLTALISFGRLDDIDCNE